MKKILLAFGTRPEAIKMCPLILELKKHSNYQIIVCLTGQHQEMLNSVMECFGIKEDYNFKIMKENQSIFSITTLVLENMEKTLHDESPDLVLVHGDTTSSFAVALASYYLKIPVGHVEAGLRTGNVYSPFPEEANRLLIDRISSLFFCPTKNNANSLENEGITSNVFITGNTVIDSFKYTVKQNYLFENRDITNIDFNKRVILVTAHRRENIPDGIRAICESISILAKSENNISFIFPMHPNPKVRQIVLELLGGLSNVILTEPLSVFDMHNLLPKVYFVMTDSGGLQEEAPHFGKPVLVLRQETERPEGVAAGTAIVCGITTDRILEIAKKLLNSSAEYEFMSRARNPYGIGNSSSLIADSIRDYLGE